jgi:hypothetical protein
MKKEEQEQERRRLPLWAETTTAVTSSSSNDERDGRNHRTTTTTLHVHSTLPDGIAIGSGPLGRCLTATQSFPRGAFLYRGYAILVDTTATSNTDGVARHSSSRNDTTTTGATSTSNNNDSSSVERHSYQLHVYRSNDGVGPDNKNEKTLIESFQLDDVNSVQDLAEAANSNSKRRQIYGLYV